MTDIFQPRSAEDMARQNAAWEALKEADTAWKATMPKITLAEYDAAQPMRCLDPDAAQDEDALETQAAYEDAWNAADFGLDMGSLGLETIARTEWDGDRGLFVVWGYDESGDHERIIAFLPVDYPVHVAGL